MHESCRNGNAAFGEPYGPQPMQWPGHCMGWATLVCKSLLVGVRIRRVRRLGELVLQFRRDRRVEVQPLGRDLLGEPFVVDFLTLAALIECCGRTIDHLLEGRIVLA